MAARMVTSCSFAVLVSKPWTARVKLSTNLKPNLYASSQLFRKGLRGLKDINDFSKQHSIFLENKPLVKNLLLLLSIFSTFSFERYLLFWGYSISFPFNSEHLNLFFVVVVDFVALGRLQTLIKTLRVVLNTYKNFLNPSDGRQPSLSSSLRFSLW